MGKRKANTVSAEVEQMLRHCAKQLEPKDGPSKRIIIMVPGGVGVQEQRLREAIQAGDVNQAALIGFQLGKAYGTSTLAFHASREISRQLGKAKQPSKTNAKAEKVRLAVKMLLREGKGMTESQEAVAKKLGLKGIRQIQRYCEGM